MKNHIMKNHLTPYSKTKPFAVGLLFSAVLALSACSGDEAPQQAAEAEKPAVQNTMDVKQPEPKAAPQPTLQQQAQEAVSNAAESIEAAKKEVKETVEKQVAAAPDGAKVYATCVACHGAKGEGGMGAGFEQPDAGRHCCQIEEV
ncbi:hypothetical protein [Thiomicrorhabdus sp.]|uniref:hypothetical protein n=1 Tax=Thiomicrorhabdus sp. TaxID=2039724 RepID=UPI0029C83BFA|nr:hypothetical protein [Thiomicrorhabdus sp.]